MDKKYGILTPKEWMGREGYQCDCDCGNTVVIKSKDLITERKKSCGCLKGNILEGCGKVSGGLHGIYERGAKSRCILFEISPKDMWDLFVLQESKCVISGVQISLDKPRTASLDRIDSKKGYTKDNIQWVHKIVNIMKWNLSQDEFISWCKQIASNNGSIS